jgi:hypothetical protein
MTFARTWSDSIVTKKLNTFAMLSCVPCAVVCTSHSWVPGGPLGGRLGEQFPAFPKHPLHRRVQQLRFGIVPSKLLYMMLDVLSFSGGLEIGVAKFVNSISMLCRQPFRQLNTARRMMPLCSKTGCQTGHDMCVSRSFCKACAKHIHPLRPKVTDEMSCTPFP